MNFYNPFAAETNRFMEEVFRRPYWDDIEWESYKEAYFAQTSFADLCAMVEDEMVSKKQTIEEVIAYHKQFRSKSC